MRLQAVKKPFSEPQRPDIVCFDSVSLFKLISTPQTVSDRMTISLPAVRVNGLFDADPEDETETLLSPTDTYEDGVESEGVAPSKGHGHHSGSISSYASSSQSLASGGTAPSAGSMVSLTMFPKPPSSQRPTSMFSERSAGPSTSTTSAVELPHTLTAPSNQTSQTLMSSSPIFTGSRTKTKNLLGRLPSLKRRAKRGETEPFPPLPYISIHSNPTERSQTLPILMPPMTPRTPTTSMSGSPSTAMPRTPTTSKMPSPQSMKSLHLPLGTRNKYHSPQRRTLPDPHPHMLSFIFCKYSLRRLRYQYLRYWSSRSWSRLLATSTPESIIMIPIHSSDGARNRQSRRSHRGDPPILPTLTW